MSDGIACPPWRINNWYLFGILAMLNLLVVWLFKEEVLRSEFIYRLMQEQMDIFRLEDQLNLLRSLFKLNYILIPLGLFIKFCFVSFILQFPLLFIADDIAYKKIFRVVMIANLAMIAGGIVQFAIIYIKPVNTIEMESLGRMPLSLAGLAAARYPDLSKPAIMVLDRFNIFELMWCSIIYYKLKSLVRMKHNDLFILVAGVWIFLLIIQWLSAEVMLLIGV